MARENSITTVFNTLNKIFQAQQPTQAAKNYGKLPAEDKKNVIKANSKEELKTDVMQHQQSRYFSNQFLKVNNINREKQYQNEGYRLAEFYDYQQMEYYPILHQALNVLAEEATVKGENGKILNVYSKDKRIKNEIEKLFEETLKVNTNLYAWAREMCKMGDCMLYLRMADNKGVKGVTQLPTQEIERIESVDDETNNVNTKFVHKHSKVDEFTIFQVAHFRLLGDTAKLPYGQSVLQNVRRYWRMLTMMEDAMMVYRVTRAAERRVVKVDVGNMPAEDIPSYVQQQADYFQKAPLVDESTGDINWKYNVATNDSDIFIPVRNSNAANPIDTLPGAQNLGEISDLSYLRDNLFTGIGVPKIFLSFSDNESSASEGKNLAQLDITFARKINRIQQALIQELNKIAILHLWLLGGDFRANATNFTLSLSNPSTQSETLRLTLFDQKLDILEKATTKTSNGIAPMSMKEAQSTIMGYSKDDIIRMAKEQIVEQKVGAEIENGDQLIKNSGLFSDLIDYVNAGIVSKDDETGEGEKDNEESNNNQEIEDNDLENKNDEPDLEDSFDFNNLTDKDFIDESNTDNLYDSNLKQMFDNNKLQTYEQNENNDEFNVYKTNKKNDYNDEFNIYKTNKKNENINYKLAEQLINENLDKFLNNQ